MSMSEAFTLIKSCCIEALYDQAWSLAPEINLLQRSQIRHHSLWYIKKRVKNLIENSTFKKQRSLNLIPSFHGKQMRKKSGNSGKLYFLGFQNHCNGDCSHEIKRQSPWNKNYGKHRQCIKKQRYQHHSLPEKCKSKPQRGTITRQSGWLLSKSL